MVRDWEGQSPYPCRAAASLSFSARMKIAVLLIRIFVTLAPGIIAALEQLRRDPKP